MDTTKAVADSLYDEFKEPLHAAPPLLQRMVDVQPDAAGREPSVGPLTMDSSLTSFTLSEEHPAAAPDPAGIGYPPQNLGQRGELLRTRPLFVIKGFDTIAHQGSSLSLPNRANRTQRRVRRRSAHLAR